MSDSWRTLGSESEVKYRRHEVWPMAWGVPSDDEGDDSVTGPLHTSVIVGAPFGGPIATMRDPSVVVGLRGGDTVSATIELHSASGTHLRSIPLTAEWRAQRIVKMGWTMEERLVVIFASGLALMFSLHSSEMVATFNVVPQGAAEVVNVEIWSHGLVALTSSFQLVYISNLDHFATETAARASIIPEARAAAAATDSLDSDLPTVVLPSLKFNPRATPTSMAVVSCPQGEAARDAALAEGLSPPIRVIVATSDCSVLFVDSNECVDKQLRGQLAEGGPISMMVLYFILFHYII